MNTIDIKVMLRTEKERGPTSTFTPASALAFSCCSVAVTVPVAPCRVA